MEIVAVQTSVDQVKADVVVQGVFSDPPPIAPITGDADTDRKILDLIENGELKGRGSSVTFPFPSSHQARHLIVVSLGSPDQWNAQSAYRTTAAVAKSIASHARETVLFSIPRNDARLINKAAVRGAIAGCQGQDLYRAEKRLNPYGKLLWHGLDDQLIAEAAVEAESQLLARRWVNEPPAEIYPESFVESARENLAGLDVEIEVWDEDRLAAENCNCLLAVGRASCRPSRLMILRYRGADHDPLAFVGKGVTFDSGGLSIKPNDGMKSMKCDMAGAATAVAALIGIARRKLPVHVIALVGLVENLIDSDVYKLGDVLTSRQGTTIEVLNTDAEGRLVLADVLDVAVENKPAAIVDLATLTGACLVALGTDVAGAMSNHDDWCQRVIDTGRQAGEAAWQLPMFPEYGEQIKSSVADIKNVGEGRWGGAITAAKLLEKFVGDVPWTHLDIAGPAFTDSPKSWQDGGGSGAFVTTLIHLAESWRGTVNTEAG
jgi:leucyl aminopeptidase